MSDTTTMPFQPGTMAEAPDAPEIEEPSGNNRLLMVLGSRPAGRPADRRLLPAVRGRDKDADGVHAAGKAA